MKGTTVSVSKLAIYVREHHYLFSLLAFLVWIAGIMTGSAFVILAGLLVYLRPLLYIDLLRSSASEKKAAEPGSDEVSQYFSGLFGIGQGVPSLGMQR